MDFEKKSVRYLMMMMTILMRRKKARAEKEENEKEKDRQSRWLLVVFSLHFSSSSSSSSENKKTHRSMERKVQCVVVCLRKEEVYRKSAFKSEGEKKVSKALPLSLFPKFCPRGEENRDKGEFF